MITLNKIPQIVVPVDVNLGLETTFLSINVLFLKHKKINTYLKHKSKLNPP